LVAPVLAALHPDWTVEQIPDVLESVGRSFDEGMDRGWAFEGAARYFDRLATENELFGPEFTGVLAEPADSLADYLDPRRMLKTFGENAPSLGVTYAAMLMGQGAFALTIGASSGNDFLTEVEAYEQETGRQVDPIVKALG